MPTYEFVCPCGHHEERILPITQAPPIGELARCPGCDAHTLARIVSVPVIADASLRASIAGYPYVSQRHRGLPGCRETGAGNPIIESPRHEREVMARTGLVRE